MQGRWQESCNPLSTVAQRLTNWLQECKESSEILVYYTKTYPPYIYAKVNYFFAFAYFKNAFIFSLKLQQLFRTLLQLLKMFLQLKKILQQEKSTSCVTMSFPDFSRRFSVSLAKSIDTFFEVLLKDFTLS